MYEGNRGHWPLAISCNYYLPTLCHHSPHEVHQIVFAYWPRIPIYGHFIELTNELNHFSYESNTATLTVDSVCICFLPHPMGMNYETQFLFFNHYYNFHNTMSLVKENNSENLQTASWRWIEMKHLYF